jgi:death-on-curing family protein
MSTIKLLNRQEIETLSEGEVVNLHKMLTDYPEILKITEPVSPSGVKDYNLLSSAVNRQNTGLDDIYIYGNIFSNCATLVYGIACNHAFHNGNKRAALLCLIKHLYKNGYVLRPTISNDEVYEFLRSIAAGELESFSFKYKDYKNLFKSLYKNRTTDKVEADLIFIEKWIQKNSESKNLTDRPLRWTDLFRKLKKFEIKADIDEGAHKVQLSKQTYIDLIVIKVKDRVKRVSYPFKGQYCSKYLIKDIRRDFDLGKSEGFDNVMFYADTEEAFFDYEIQLFKKAIYKLSKN